MSNVKKDLLMVRSTIIRIVGLTFSAADYRLAAKQAINVANRLQAVNIQFREKLEETLGHAMLSELMIPTPEIEEKLHLDILYQRSNEEQVLDLPSLELDPLAMILVMERLKMIIPLHRAAATAVVDVAANLERDAKHLTEELEKAGYQEEIEKLLKPALQRPRKPHLSFWILVNNMYLDDFIDELKAEAVQSTNNSTKTDQHNEATILFSRRKNRPIKPS